MNSDVVIIDDDASVRMVLSKIMGGCISEFKDAESLMSYEQEDFQPKVFFVDVHLGEGQSGIDVIPKIRARWPHSVIIVITGDHDEHLLATALANGANDFIQKPLRPVEVDARVSARLSEAEVLSGSEQLDFCDATLHLRQRKLVVGDGTTFLSPLAVELLRLLLASRNAPVSRELLTQRLWGDTRVSANALDQRVLEVRRALKDLSSDVKLESIYGKGLRLMTNPIKQQPMTGQAAA